MISILTSKNTGDLHLFKNILESNNIACQIKEENIQSHQYYTSPGGKLLINDYDLYDAQKILSKYGNNQADAAINIGVELSEEELLLKGELRKLNDIDAIKEFQKTYFPKGISKSVSQKIFSEEMQYIIHRNNNKFDLNEFLAHLFEGKVFDYINRNKSTKYEIENELIERLKINDEY